MAGRTKKYIHIHTLFLGLPHGSSIFLIAKTNSCTLSMVFLNIVGLNVNNSSFEYPF